MAWRGNTFPKVVRVAVVVALIAAFGLSLAGSGAKAQSPGPPPEIIADADGNKIFDNLESRLHGAEKGARFDVLVQFERPLGSVYFRGLRQDIGPFTLRSKYPSINGIATSWTKGQILNAAQRGIVRQIELDAPVELYLDDATYSFAVDEAMTDFDVDGNADGFASYSKDDIVIAVVDTGIDGGHTDLGGGKIIGWKDFINNQPTPYDDNSHGTHVAGTAAGTGAASGGAYQGVAPGAALVGVKVLDGGGGGTLAGVADGVQWVINNKNTYGIDILSMSLGASGCSDGTDSLSSLINAAAGAGIVSVVAAGNSGPLKCTIGTPAAAASAVTVGAVADPGEGGVNLAYFSSRGPTADDRIKPDVVAPGVNIMAPEATTTSGYVNKSGTSMATPFVSGVAALMLDANGSLTPTDVKNYLTTSADDWGASGRDIDYGYGVIDPYAAIGAASGTTGSRETVLPTHTQVTGTLSGTGDVHWVDIEVTDTSMPLAVTMILPETQPHSNIWYWWFSGCEQPDFDIYLYPPGAADTDPYVAYSETCWRQDEFGYQPTTSGTYRLKVYSFDGAGPYILDISGGQAGGGGSTDSAPSVTVTSPADSATVSGTITVAADANDDDAVTQVEFFVDGASIGVDIDGADGWSATWDTTFSTEDADHTVTATATDTADQAASHSVTVRVDNTDNLPSVQITSPVNGATVLGAATITVDASDDRGMSQVQFFVDGISIGVDTDGADGWSAAWGTTAVADGGHTVTAEATDTGAQTVSHSIGVTVDNTAPSVSITSPLDGDTVSGAVDITAGASDATSGVVQVEYFVEGTSIGVDSDGSDGWSTTWDTTSVSNGSQALTATATDAAGNSTTSSLVTVTVDNATATAVIVDSVTYATAGGKNGDLHLSITVALVDNQGNPVSGASVSIFLEATDDGTWIGAWSGTRTTGDDGTVRFRLRKAPSGCYETTVTSVIADGLGWGFITPANGFCK